MTLTPLTALLSTLAAPPEPRVTVRLRESVVAELATGAPSDAALAAVRSACQAAHPGRMHPRHPRKGMLA